MDFFRRGFRSVYVNEIDETLSLGFDETQKLVGRVQEVFENHLSATEVLVQDPLGLLKAKYTTRTHRLFVMEELWQGFFMVRCVSLRVASLCCVLVCFLAIASAEPQLSMFVNLCLCALDLSVCAYLCAHAAVCVCVRFSVLTKCTFSQTESNSPIKQTHKSPQAMAVELLILCVALYSYLWKTPFFTHGIEVLFFFLPYYFTAALPTGTALNWKRTLPDPVSPFIQILEESVPP